MPDCEGWVLKKPTSESDKTWAEANTKLQRRYIESTGSLVEYFGVKSVPKAKARGKFDLRQVAHLSESQDATAPPAAVDLIVKNHSVTLCFDSHTERDSFLRVWIMRVPATSIAAALSSRLGGGAKSRAACARTAEGCDARSTASELSEPW